MTPIIRSGFAPAGSAKRRLYGRSRKHWQVIRLHRLALDGYRCQIRLDGCLMIATTVDLDPAVGGNHDLATLGNTRSACAFCHGKVDGAGARKGWQGVGDDH